MGKIIENYSLQTELGSGGYSRVFKAVNLKTNQLVAIKVVKAAKFRQLPKLQQGTINEINILTNLEPCPHIIRYYDMLKTVNNFYFVYEYCSGGTLQQLLKKTGCLSETTALKYFKQIIDAFKILSKNNIMHRDLKPENILLHEGVLKIADFGFCKVLENPDEMAQTMLGSPIYMAPEILKGQSYTIKADIWSLGVVLYRMIFGFCPFQSVNIAQLIMILENQQLSVPSQPKVSSVIVQLIKRMLTKDPKKRADWQQVFSYQITEDGTMKKSGYYKTEDLLSNSLMTMASQTENAQQQSPQNSSMKITTSTKNCIQKNQPIVILESKSGFYDKNQKIGQYKSTIARVSQPNLRDRSKSPIRERANTKMDGYLKTHSKTIDILGMAIETATYANPHSLAISYALVKGVEFELNSIIISAQKESASDIKGSGEYLYDNVLRIVTEELESIRRSADFYRDQLLVFKNIDISSIEMNKKIHLKQFIKGLQLEGRQELVMASRLIDYIQQSLLIRKETYEKLSKDQLQRQIKNNSKLSQTKSHY